MSSSVSFSPISSVNLGKKNSEVPLIQDSHRSVHWSDILEQFSKLSRLVKRKPCLSFAPIIGPLSVFLLIIYQTFNPISILGVTLVSLKSNFFSFFVVIPSSVLSAILKVSLSSPLYPNSGTCNYNHFLIAGNYVQLVFILVVGYPCAAMNIDCGNLKWFSS